MPTNVLLSVNFYRIAGLFVLCLIAAAPTRAQDRRPGELTEQEELQVEQGTRVAETIGGEVGQRQAREAPAANGTSLGRINSRVSNRVENRLRNRLDRYYNPQADTTSSYEVASERTRTMGRGGLR